MAAAISTTITSVSRMANWGEKALTTRGTGPVPSANRVWHHRGDHAVVLLPGAAAAEEGDEEDDDPDPDDDDGHAGGRGVVDLVGVVHGDLHHDADHDQGQAAQLQGSEGEVRVQGGSQVEERRPSSTSHK